MEECLGVNGRQLFVWVHLIWKRENMGHWCNVLLYNRFYGRPCHFNNVSDNHKKVNLVALFEST